MSFPPMTNQLLSLICLVKNDFLGPAVISGEAAQKVLNDHDVNFITKKPRLESDPPAVPPSRPAAARKLLRKGLIDSVFLLQPDNLSVTVVKKYYVDEKKCGENYFDNRNAVCTLKMLKCCFQFHNCDVHARVFSGHLGPVAPPNCVVCSAQFKLITELRGFMCVSSAMNQPED